MESNAILAFDTNILLLEASNLVKIPKQLGYTQVLIPETVLDEIDSKKSGTSEIAYQARSVARILASAERISSTKTGATTDTILRYNGIDIHIYSMGNYPQFSEAEQNIKNDRKIIHTIDFVARSYDVVFCTNDVMCGIRAEAEGLKVIDYKAAEVSNIEFTKRMTVAETEFPELHDTPILQVNPNHKQENYNYIFECNGQQKLATVSNGLIKILGKVTEEELHRQDLTPANSGQLFLSKAIQDPTIDIVVCESKAGSGKTACALSNGIRLVSKGLYDGIVYIRSSVDDLEEIEKIGFLSGNDEKVEVYLKPLEDTLDFFARNRLKDSKKRGEEFEKDVAETVIKLRTRCNIQGMITLGLRGRTIRNKYVIVDEIGNLSKSAFQKVLTRFGEGCKIVLIGSNNQIDNPYLNKYTNGLSTILDACRKPQDRVKLHAVTLERVVRGRIAEFAENLYSKS